MNEQLLIEAAMVRAFEVFDAAWGTPFNVKPPATRLDAHRAALHGLTLASVQWAIQAALATMHEHPDPAQLRRLAQASPPYQAHMRSKKQPAVEQPMRCEACGEPRAQHRYRPQGAPRPFVAVVIRHRESCPVAQEVRLPWEDPPMFGTLTVDQEAWERREPEGNPVALYTPELLGPPRPWPEPEPTDPDVDEAAREEKRQAIKRGVLP